MADAAVAAAQTQHTAVSGESTAAAVVNTLARSVLALDEEIAAVDARIAARFREHRDAEVILSMPGMGPLLGAEFIACTGGDMDAFGTAGCLAGVAGLAPVPRDSGRISGNKRRPHRYHRRLLRVFYRSAQIAARFCPTSKTSTTANGPRARATSRRSSPSLGDASTSYGPSSAISEPSRLSLPHGDSPRPEPQTVKNGS